jgi:hypothetical protein
MKMKTKTNISNLKKLGLTALTALVLSTGMKAGDYSNAMVNLNVYMKAQEQAILYKAPVSAETEETALAIENLENFVKAEQASILYRAPESTEATDIEATMDELNAYIASEQASLMYKAPAVDVEVEVAVELEDLQMFADKMNAEIKYSAPETAGFDSDDQMNNADTMMAETR